MAYNINIYLNDEAETSSITGSASSDFGKEKTTSAGTKALGGYIASQMIQPFVDKTIQHVTSNVELTTGSTQLQKKVDFAMTAVNKGLGLVSAMAGGMAMTGGHPAGLAIGATIWAINEMVNIGFNQRELNLKREDAEIQRGYLINRMGPAYNMSRRG